VVKKAQPGDGDKKKKQPAPKVEPAAATPATPPQPEGLVLFDADGALRHEPGLLAAQIVHDAIETYLMSLVQRGATMEQVHAVMAVLLRRVAGVLDCVDRKVQYKKQMEAGAGAMAHQILHNLFSAAQTAQGESPESAPVEVDVQSGGLDEVMAKIPRDERRVKAGDRVLTYDSVPENGVELFGWAAMHGLSSRVADLAEEKGIYGPPHEWSTEAVSSLRMTLLEIEENG